MKFYKKAQKPLLIFTIILIVVFVVLLLFTRCLFIQLPSGEKIFIDSNLFVAMLDKNSYRGLIHYMCGLCEEIVHFSFATLDISTLLCVCLSILVCVSTIFKLNNKHIDGFFGHLSYFAKYLLFLLVLPPYFGCTLIESWLLKVSGSKQIIAAQYSTPMLLIASVLCLMFIIDLLDGVIMFFKAKKFENSFTSRNDSLVIPLFLIPVLIAIVMNCCFSSLLGYDYYNYDRYNLMKELILFFTPAMAIWVVIEIIRYFILRKRGIEDIVLSKEEKININLSCLVFLLFLFAPYKVICPSNRGGYFGTSAYIINIFNESVLFCPHCRYYNSMAGFTKLPLSLFYLLSLSLFIPAVYIGKKYRIKNIRVIKTSLLLCSFLINTYFILISFFQNLFYPLSLNLEIFNYTIVGFLFLFISEIILGYICFQETRISKKEKETPTIRHMVFCCIGITIFDIAYLFISFFKIDNIVSTYHDWDTLLPAIALIHSIHLLILMFVSVTSLFISKMIIKPKKSKNL